MAGPLRLSDDEAWDVLARAHTGILTSLRADGVPVALPVWFVVLDRRIYVSGPASTWKFRRIARDPRVSFLVESGTRWSELCGVHVTGRAHPVDDRGRRARVADALDAKYSAFRTPRAEMPAATRARYETALATIEIVADDRILSWDNARLSAAPPED